ncbi:MAG: hypothetical protein QF467_02965 [SAR202 cluster bacterium]|nr:hypothetical protein [SAR202 cluster bacterium]
MVRYIASAFAVVLLAMPAQPAFAVAEDEVAFSSETFALGTTAEIFVKDADLNVTSFCTARWAGISTEVPQETWWSLSSGAPATAVFTLSPGCYFDRVTPADTPLVLPPADQQPWASFVDGVLDFVDDFNSQAGEISLLNGVDPGGDVQVEFHFEFVNAYLDSDRRARVYSTSDQTGEWFSIGEVVSEEDFSLNPSTGLFKGEVVLSGDGGAVGSGDGAVWVQVGDTVTAVYYEADGSTVIATHQAAVVPAPTPTPTPVSSAGRVGLILLAGLFVAAVLWRLRAVWVFKLPG